MSTLTLSYTYFRSTVPEAQSGDQSS
jgi:hypothetical protein